MIRFVKRWQEIHKLESIDRVRIGHTGGTYEVFAPKWWQLNRWFFWWTTKRVRGEVCFETRMLTGDVVRRTVKVWEVPPIPRVRIEDQFKRPPLTR